MANPVLGGWLGCNTSDRQDQPADCNTFEAQLRFSGPALGLLDNTKSSSDCSVHIHGAIPFCTL